MADHFAGEIFTFAVIIAFIGVVLFNFSGSVSESNYERIEISEDSDFDQSWIQIGNDFNNLESLMPSEFFDIIIVPLILLGVYISVKFVTGILPNWISGG